MSSTDVRHSLYPRAVNLRWLAIALFAVAAVLIGIGNSMHERWIVAIAILCFLLGAAAFLRWRTAEHARVLDREEKTSHRNGDK
jgi:hypothetical protein